jgi:hypothetical protein
MSSKNPAKLPNIVNNPVNTRAFRVLFTKIFDLAKSMVKVERLPFLTETCCHEIHGVGKYFMNFSMTAPIQTKGLTPTSEAMGQASSEASVQQALTIQGRRVNLYFRMRGGGGMI